jgi:hypothetical protein
MKEGQIMASSKVKQDSGVHAADPRLSCEKDVDNKMI